MFSFRTLLLLLSLWTWCVCEPDSNQNRIPKFVPQGYHLDLFPDVSAGFLKGFISINIAIYAEPSNVIELDADPTVVIHYKSIKVSEMSKDGKHDTNRTKLVYEVTAVERVLFDLGTLKIHLSQNLQRDITYQVHISFETTLKNDSNNQPFYMRTFFDSETHVERKFVIMDLTKTGCYKAFPCFNQLEYKSWVSLSVIRQPNFYALSTAPVNYTTNVLSDGSLVKDFFLNTPPMSMNSLALVVSDYRRINALRSEGPTNKNDGTRTSRPREIASVVKMILKSVEERLGIPFPLSSFHVVMVPKSANIPYINAFGLLVLNVSNSNDDFPLTQDLAFGACFQWFVHVATPATENSTTHITINHLKNVISEEVAENVEINSSSKFDYGQLAFTKLVRTSTENLLSSSRASSKIFERLALSMLDRVFPNIVSQAMHKLLRKKEFKIYTDADVWSAFYDVVNKTEHGRKEHFETPDLRLVIDSWRKAKLVSLITVRREYISHRINVTREPFIYATYKYSALKLRENLPRLRAPILPIVVSQPSNFVNNNQLIGWMTAENHSRTFELGQGINPTDFIVANPGHLGPFVVNYDEENWRLLTQNFDSLSGDIQLQLLVDSLALANIGLLDYSVFLNMSAAMIPDERHLPVWIQYSALVADVTDRFHGQLADKYKEFLSRQRAIFFPKITEGRSDKYSDRVKNMIKKMKYRLDCLTDRSYCFTAFEYENLVHEARLGKRLTGNHNCQVIRNVSVIDWQIIANGLFHAIHNSTAIDRFQTLYILSCTEHPLAFETYMNLLLLNFNKSSLLLTEEDQKYVIARMDHSHLRALQNFADKHFFALKERLTRGTWMVLIDSIIKSTNSEEDMEELKAFCRKYAGQFDDETEKLVNDGLAMISAEIKWKFEIFPALEELLDSILRNFDDTVRLRTRPNRNSHYGLI